MHINIGRPVAHNRFGVGFVTAIDGKKITVDFHADRSSRKILKSFLRAPTKGLLPHHPMPASDGADAAQFAGFGNVPFTVVDAGIDEFVGATVAQFVIEDASGNLAAINFVLEHADATVRRENLSRFAEFGHALGVLKPDNTDDFIGKKACIHVLTGDLPTFNRLAA